MVSGDMTGEFEPRLRCDLSSVDGRSKGVVGRFPGCFPGFCHENSW